MSGRRTWMPEETAATPENEALANNSATDSTNDSATMERADVHQGQRNPKGDASQEMNATEAGEGEAQEASSGVELSRETSRERSRRGWVPGETGARFGETSAGFDLARDDSGSPDSDTAVMDGPTVNRGADTSETGALEGAVAQKEEPAQKASGPVMAEADTTDIPLNPGGRSRASHEEPRNADEQPQSTRSAGVWSSVRNRISGKGPLSADREEQDERERAKKAEQAIEVGGSMDPNERMKRLSSSIRSGDHEPSTAPEEEEDDREGLVASGPLLWFIDHWIPITVPLVLLFIGMFMFATMFTSGPSGEELASSQSGSGSNDTREEAGSQSGKEQVPLYESGLTFEYSQKDGKAELTAGELSWNGEVEGGGDDDPKETITLAGPTAAKINRGYRMEGDSTDPGEVETMTYAVEAEDAPDIHATYQRFSGGSTDGPVEAPSGSYSVTEDSGNLIAEGTYSDRRTGDGDEVIRTYTEHIPGQKEPDQFRVRYEAPPETPIPALVGWQEPGDRDAGEDAQG